MATGHGAHVTDNAVREPAARLSDTVGAIAELDAIAMARCRSRLDQLTKPPGSLGRLEDLAVQLAGITGDPEWHPGRRTIVVFAADHGVTARGVSAYPQAVTGQMVANYLAGGAAINVLARRAGSDVLVVDVGVVTSTLSPPELPTGVRYLAGRIRAGTADMTLGPAMTHEDALAAIEVGLEIAAAEAQTGTTLLACGEMGIANTTSASAVVAAMTSRPVVEVTGLGTGVDADGRRRKIAAIERALEVNAPDPHDPVGVLSAVGGLELAALAGLMLGAARMRLPVLLDGFITGAAALVAAALSPALPPRLIASHRSAEPGHRIVLEHLGLRPLLELDLRLGEGTGAALAMPLLDAACDLRNGMATFGSAGVSARTA